MKKYFILVVFILPITACSSQNSTKTANEYGVFFFERLVNNDFEGFKKSFPNAPFIMDFSTEKHNYSVEVTQEKYDKQVQRIEIAFNKLVQIISGKDVKLEKIMTESFAPFKTTEIYLYISYPIEELKKKKHRIRIEDCYIHNGKYMPEQLKYSK